MFLYEGENPRYVGSIHKQYTEGEDKKKDVPGVLSTGTAQMREHKHWVQSEARGILRV